MDAPSEVEGVTCAARTRNCPKQLVPRQRPVYHALFHCCARGTSEGTASHAVLAAQERKWRGGRGRGGGGGWGWRWRL